MKKYILSLGGLAILLQFIPYGKNHLNPPVETQVSWDSPKTKELFYKACADCHSNETKYPWYSNLAPISWLVQHDIDEGREHFNISSKSGEKDGHEAAEEIEKGGMPMSIYVLMHKEAKLSQEEKETLANGLEKTFN